MNAHVLLELMMTCKTMSVLVILVTTHVILVTNTTIIVLPVTMPNTESTMTRTIVDVSMDIMMLELKLVPNVTSNVPNVLTEYLVKNVLETEVNQKPSVPFAQMENMMIQYPSIVKNVQKNGTLTV